MRADGFFLESGIDLRDGSTGGSDERDGQLRRGTGGRPLMERRGRGDGLPDLGRSLVESASLAQVGTTATTGFTHEADPGQTHFYSIRATNAGGPGSFSNPASTFVTVPTGGSDERDGQFRCGPGVVLSWNAVAERRVTRSGAVPRRMPVRSSCSARVQCRVCRHRRGSGGNALLCDPGDERERFGRVPTRAITSSRFPARSATRPCHRRHPDKPTWRRDLQHERREPTPPRPPCQWKPPPCRDHYRAK